MQMASPPVTNQDQTSPLTQAPLKREIRGGGQQSFKISVAAGQYMRLLIEQHGIILQATLFDSHHNWIAEMDSPSFGHGPIYLSVIAPESQDYLVEVLSTESWANPAWFEVMIDEQRASTAIDRDRIAAETLFAAARRLAKGDTASQRNEALTKYKESLDRWERLGDVHWSATTHYAIGSLYRSLGENKDAADSFSETLSPDLASKLKEDDWRLIASAWSDLGLTAADLNDEKTAFDSLYRALQIFQNHGDRRGMASAFNNIGYTYKGLGRYQEAVEYFEQALPLRRAENDQLREFNVINNIGTIYDATGDPQKALESCAETLKTWQELYKKGLLQDPDRLAGALNNTAAAHERLGEWQKALDSYAEALAISRKSGNAQRQASTLNNLGKFYQEWGDAAQAREYYDQALDLIRNKVKDPRAEANVLTQIGRLLLSDGKLTEALQYFNNSMVIPQSPQREAELLNNIGMAYLLAGNPAEALKFHNKALAKITAIHDPRGEAATRNKMAEAYTRLGSPSLALAELQTALSLWRAVKDSRGEVLALEDMAQAEHDLNNLKVALQLSDEAVGIIESLRTEVFSSRLRRSYFATQQNYYELNIGLNMTLYKQSNESARLAVALDASEKSRSRSLLDTLFGAREKTTQDANETLLQRERDLEYKISAKSEAQTELLSTKHNVNEAMIVANDLNKLMDESEQVKELIRVSNPKYARLTQPQILTTTEIQQQLDDGTLLLEYSLGDKRGYVWAVTPDSVNGFELPGRKEIEAAARSVTDALLERGNSNVKNESPQQWQRRLDRADAEYAKSSVALSKMVIEPVAALLGKKRLVIVADGVLQRVPFGALPDPNGKVSAEVSAAKPNPLNRTAPEDVRPLIENHEIVYEPSASVLALERNELKDRKPAPRTVAVFADPVFDQADPRVRNARRNGNSSRPSDQRRQDGAGLPGPSLASTNQPPALTRALGDVGLGKIPWLPFSREEGEAILKIAPKGQTMAAMDFKASRATATSPELANYRVIHFATHGVVDLNHPELSGILLSMVDEKGRAEDGYLRLHEIYNLNLPADLVVLSACQTGIGKQIKGEGLIALTRGFMYAGAARVVASLWKVDDAATAELMGEFYKQMFTNGLKPAAALRAAQVKLSQQKRWRSPYYWAGFVLQGEWK
jgi:CHAT domain-containing protein/Tfp pilus assembly protein PilF